MGIADRVFVDAPQRKRQSGRMGDRRREGKSTTEIYELQKSTKARSVAYICVHGTLNILRRLLRAVEKD